MPGYNVFFHRNRQTFLPPPAPSPLPIPTATSVREGQDWARLVHGPIPGACGAAPSVCGTKERRKRSWVCVAPGGLAPRRRSPFRRAGQRPGAAGRGSGICLGCQGGRTGISGRKAGGHDAPGAAQARRVRSTYPAIPARGAAARPSPTRHRGPRFATKPGCRAVAARAARHSR